MPNRDRFRKRDKPFRALPIGMGNRQLFHVHDGNNESIRKLDIAQADLLKEKGANVTGPFFAWNDLEDWCLSQTELFIISEKIRLHRQRLEGLCPHCGKPDELPDEAHHPTCPKYKRPPMDEYLDEEILPFPFLSDDLMDKIADAVAAKLKGAEHAVESITGKKED